MVEKKEGRLSANEASKLFLKQSKIFMEKAKNIEEKQKLSDVFDVIRCCANIYRNYCFLPIKEEYILEELKELGYKIEKRKDDVVICWDGILYGNNF